MENIFIKIVAFLVSIPGILVLLLAFSSIFDDSRSKHTEESFNKSLNKQLKKHFSKTKNLTKICWVGDEHRSHPWSKMPGGCTVVVVYTTGKAYGYDKVKRPHRYMKQIIGKNIIDVFNRNDNIQISLLQEYIEGICITKEDKITLNKVWDNTMDSQPWQYMKEYATK
tara:strand:- start:1079 stop:1582 length:504 start_codon:yes stop_codon:yes gene_type:complete